MRVLDKLRSQYVLALFQTVVQPDVLHGTHHHTKIHRKDDGKVVEKEMVREPRGVASPKRKKVEPKGKEKVKERKDNVSTKSQSLQKSSGQADLGNNGQITLGILKHIRVLKNQQPLRNFNMLLSVNFDFRVWVLPNTLNLFSLTDWILRSELSHLVLIPLHEKLLFLQITLLHVDI